MSEKLKVVAITSCPTGIAHTFMAAKALEMEANKRGIDFKVQKNGSQGKIDPLSEQAIKEADYVIIAADIKVDTDQFVGKKIFNTTAKKAMSKADWIFDNFEKNAKIYSATDESVTFFKGKWNMYKHCLTGISYMLPFVVAGGIMTAISFFFGIYSADVTHPDQYNKFAHSMKTIGEIGMGLMVPALAAYTSFAIGDRAAIVPGFVGGYAAQNGFGGLVNENLGQNFSSGFLGGIVAGLLAGYFIQLLKMATHKMPEKFNGVKSMLIFPVVGSFVIGMVTFWGLNIPVGYLQQGLNSWLQTLGGTDAGSATVAQSLALGTAMGILMAVDYGGPINKIAYLFGTAHLASTLENGNQPSMIMAAVCAGCTMPSLATAAAVSLFPQKYTLEERNAGYTNYVLGATMIAEGAIPFAAKRPQYNIPMLMVGCVISTNMSLLLGCATYAPHGGLIVLPLIEGWYWWLLAVIIGSLVSAVLLGLTAQSPWKPKELNWTILKWQGKRELNKKIKGLSAEKQTNAIQKFNQEFSAQMEEGKALYAQKYQASYIDYTNKVYEERMKKLIDYKERRTKAITKMKGEKSEQARAALNKKYETKSTMFMQKRDKDLARDVAVKLRG